MRKRVALIAVLLGLATSLGGYVLRSQLIGALPIEVQDFIRGHWHGFALERDVMVPMPDGVHIATNIYKPRSKAGPYATILMRLPYNKNMYPEAVWAATLFAEHGYAVAVQDVRGTFASEGTFTPSKLEAEDGSASIDWIVRQPWSNGRVGTFGCSSLGESQMFLARMRNPNHRAIIAQGSGGAMGTAAGRYTFFGLYEGGIFNLASGFGWFVQSGSKHAGHMLKAPVNVGTALWGLPSGALVSRYRSDPTDYEDFISKPPGDPYWRDLGYIADEDRFATPALVINSWHDQTVADSLVLSELMRRNADTKLARDNQHVVIAPGDHCNFDANSRSGKVGDLELGPAAVQPYWDWYFSWFDYWLLDKKGSLPKLPPYLLYVIGEDRWVSANEWPPHDVKYQLWYLDGSSAANSVRGGGTLSPNLPVGPNEVDELRYDPAVPVPTRGGPICCTGNPNDRSGPIDQADVEARPDVLVYTSSPLDTGVRIVGPLRAELYVSSSARDTDFTAKLVDVRPDGRALNIQEGALRMRYRDGYTHPTLLDPETIYKVSLDMRAIAYYLPPGHRLRLQISSSNFPRLERNLNTGGKNYDEVKMVVARNRVFHDAARPSAIVLPLLEMH